MSNTERWPSAADRRQVQLMTSTEPKGAVPMVAQLIVSIGMHEHVERCVIERKPTYDVGKLRRRKRDLVAPSWMGSDLSLMNAAHLNPIAKLRGHHFAKFPGGIATGHVEIDMRMPARDTRHIEIRHCRPFGSRANLLPSIRLQLKLSSRDCKFVCHRSRKTCCPIECVRTVVDTASRASVKPRPLPAGDSGFREERGTPRSSHRWFESGCGGDRKAGTSSPIKGSARVRAVSRIADIVRRVQFRAPDADRLPGAAAQ